MISNVQTTPWHWHSVQGVRSDGRSGTRYHAFSEPSNANVDDLNWFSGSILATNVEEVDVKSKTEGEEKKIKVSLGY